MGKPSKPTFNETFSYKLIYIYTIDDERHKGLLKIGDTSISSKLIPDPEQVQPNSKLLNQAARKRINHQTNTAAVVPRLIHTELAIRYVVSSQNRRIPELFRDYQIHEVLKNSNYKPYEWEESRSKEWFKIDIQTALQAIDAYKKGFSNLSHAPSSEILIPVSFRPEQEKAISQTVERFKTGNRFLWNAKMRFGKTLCALEVVRQMRFRKTIIITHRPVVDEGWYSDFKKIFIWKKDPVWLYGSKGHGNTLQKLIQSEEHFIYFASIQDLRGSEQVGGNFDKNTDVFRLDWDCVIIDESHEGTTTDLGAKVREALLSKKKGHVPKLLELSGTPFNRMPEFDAQETYTWDYVMEQRAKAEWDEKHEDDSNPYADLPEMQIYTYDLGDLIHSSEYIDLLDKAFNFAEFFRVNPETGSFIHESDVKRFLDLISKESDTSHYPFTTEESRDLFRHTLWMVPGVAAAKALKELMLAHSVFGCGAFQIINVAGNEDEEVRPDKALEAVRAGIQEAGEDGYTITLSCGRLTTGVTVREWTAVMMLSGTTSTSAASYLQTIFRVQSPCSSFGRMKERCYVFDFAPDRTLRMIAEAVHASAKPGKTTDGDKQRIGEFLNFCPVISIDGTRMTSYDTPHLLQELKRAYIERVVKDGFDTESLYSDELFKLTREDLQKFEHLKGIIGSSKAAPRTGDIDINRQGFTDEEYEEVERIQKKPPKKRTAEELERLRKLREQREQKQNAISILRGISIRMPLLIYGAKIPIDRQITLSEFVKMIDSTSWEEFMPQGVTKELFKKFIQYYDEEVFIAAGNRI
ncbi:MAG: DEAD/DEAH box helicase, partial [Thermoguttaceae bacterium]